MGSVAVLQAVELITPHLLELFDADHIYHSNRCAQADAAQLAATGYSREGEGCTLGVLLGGN